MNDNLSIGNIRFISRFTDKQDEFTHTHDFYEIVFITYGTIKHKINGKIYSMTTGDAFVIAPGIKHTFMRNDDCGHRDIMINNVLMKEVCDFLDKDFFEIINTEGVIKFTMTASQMENFENTYLSFDTNENESVKHVYEKVICTQLLGILHSKTQSSSHNSHFKSKCLTIINEYFSQKNALEILRTELGYTQGHLCKKFRSEFSMTPTDYINIKRITLAASLLSLTNYTIEKCCYSIGFDSIPHFTKLFKTHFGVTPAKYRKQRQNSVDTLIGIP